MPYLSSRNFTLEIEIINKTKMDIKFVFLSNITGFLYIVPNILSGIVDNFYQKVNTWVASLLFNQLKT